MPKYLDKQGLNYFWGKIKAKLDTKVDKVDGKGLSTNDYTTTEKDKLAGIAAGAQVNIVETIKVNGSALTPTSKAVNIDLSNYATKDSIASVYNYKGSTTFSNLTTLVTNKTCKTGDVYNVTEEFTTTAAFVEGAGKKYPAGTNVVCVNTNGTVTLDILGGDYTALAAQVEGNAELISDLQDDLANKVDKSTYERDMQSINGDIQMLDSNLNYKVDKVNGKGLSTNDYTTTEKEKLANIEEEANKTVVDSVFSTTSTNPVQNKVINSKFQTLEGQISDLEAIIPTAMTNTEIDTACNNYQ